MSKFILIQPKYVKNFKCDGKFCPTNCCRRNWNIDVDEYTFEKYKKIESAEKEITSHIIFNEDRKMYLFQHDEKKACHFLTEDKLCSIQKKYGENFLPTTCKLYPRFYTKIGNIYECSLTLSCPIAAELALTSDDAIKLEIMEFSRSDLPDTPNNIPESIKSCFSVIQLAATFILKNRDLTLDQRLAILGFFWRDVDNFIKDNKADEIESLAKSYMSPNFLKEKGAGIFAGITFNRQKFLATMIDGILKNLYEDNSVEGNAYISLKKFFMPTVDGGKENLTEIAERNFFEWEYIRSNFIKKMDTVFSNYIINDIFLNLYPWRITGPVAHNFATLIATYKIVEWYTMMNNYKNPQLKGVINCISEACAEVNHSKTYLKKIIIAVKGEEDITEIISTYLFI